ncbi:hypothetical protein ACFLRY_05525, partial [Bacteroidota bacterium]
TEDLLAKVIQWEASIHATGGNFERNDVGCAPCHTSMGFKEVIVTGLQETAAAIDNPTPPNCYTCHAIHETYTAADWALRLTGAVELWNNPGVTNDYGTGSVCIQCHQMRVVSPAVNPATPTATVDITSSRWGGHHGPQTNILSGNGGYEFTGGTYPNSFHTANVTNGCVDCHMANAFGAQAGGHTMNVAYLYHGSTEPNLAGCMTSGCHTDEDALVIQIEDTQAEIDTLLVHLEHALTAAGIFNPSNGLMNTGTWTMDQAGAYLNYQIVEEDRSKGVHNFKYAKALLENSLAAVKD